MFFPIDGFTDVSMGVLHAREELAGTLEKLLSAKGAKIFGVIILKLHSFTSNNYHLST